MPAAQNLLDRYNDTYNYLSNKNLLPSNVRKNFQIGSDFPEYVNYLDSIANQDRQKTRSNSIGSKSGNNLAPEELTEQAYKLLAQDRARLSGTNYPVYKGQTIAPMSTLTQRAEELRNKFNKRPAPYSRQLETVLNRNNQGITQENIQGLLGQLGNDQRRFGQGDMLGALRNQFLNSYEPRAAGFNQKAESDISAYLPQTAGALGDISRISGHLEGSRNQQIARTLQNLQADKQARQRGLVSNLEDFGSQKHAYTNMVNNANRNQFNQEANEPYRKMQMLQQALASGGGNGQEMHPDLAKVNGAETLQALRAYGVDPTKPVREWSGNNTPSSRYPGKLVADLPPEILASHNVLERLNPTLRDAYTDKRKALTAGLVGNDNISSRALQNLSPAMQGKMSLLERDARERMQKDLGVINNQYIQLGQYGSPQHMAAAEERARQLNRSVLERRDDYLQGGLKDQLELQHRDEIGNIRQLGQIGAQSHNNFGNLLGTIRDTNRVGSTKFANDQAENEELYKNYHNERAWQWPHMRNSIRNETLNEILGPAASRNIGLDNLANLDTRYSNLNRESNRQNPDITSERQARDQLQRQQQEQIRQQEYQRKQQAEQQQMAQQRQQQLQTEQAMESAKNNYWNTQKSLSDFQNRGFAPYRSDNSNPYYQFGDAYKNDLSRYNSDLARLQGEYNNANKAWTSFNAYRG